MGKIILLQGYDSVNKRFISLLHSLGDSSTTYMLPDGYGFFSELRPFVFGSMMQSSKQVIYVANSVLPDIWEGYTDINTSTVPA